MESHGPWLPRAHSYDGFLSPGASEGGLAIEVIRPDTAALRRVPALPGVGHCSGMRPEVCDMHASGLDPQSP